jgi:hypothetical protein
VIADEDHGADPGVLQLPPSEYHPCRAHPARYPRRDWPTPVPAIADGASTSAATGRAATAVTVAA